MKVVSVAEMQAVEREADASGLTYSQMMEHAGRGLAEEVEKYIGETEKNLSRLQRAAESIEAVLFFDEGNALSGRRSEVKDSHDRYALLEIDELVQKLQAETRKRFKGCLGLVGSGNNGGDTLVALAHLADKGWKASAYLVRPRPADDPLVERLEQAGGQVISGQEDQDARQLMDALADHALLLDGVLGTGIQLPLRGQVAEILSKVKEYLFHNPGKLRNVAVDCPSGVDCDSGEAAPESLAADVTVTMAGVKTGLLKPPASQLTGALRVVSIGLETLEKPVTAWESIRREVVDRQVVTDVLPARPPDAHKGTFGTVLVVAGSVNYTGAALLAGKAAYRVGAGLVTLAVPESLHATLAGHFPEATWLPLPEEMGVIAWEAAQVVWGNLQRPTAMLLGPGFGIEEATRKFLFRLLDKTSPPRRSQMGFIRSTAQDEDQEGSQLPPLVVDADGLKLLAELPDWPAKLPGVAILTPHPGEMAILTGLEVAEIQADRLRAAERFAKEWNHMVVLKGANTLVAAPDGRSGLIPVATAALARAGTGDVLAGLIAGLRAQGVEPFESACAGCWIHAQSGLFARQQVGSAASVLAGDVLAAVSTVMSSLER